MTKEELNAILSRVRSWPEARQEDAAKILLAMEAQQVQPYRLSAEERADIEAALAEIAHDSKVDEKDVAEVFNRYRR